MLKVYHKIIRAAEKSHGDIGDSAKIINKRSAGSSKLRVLLKDGSYLDIWFSVSGKYSFHWEQRAQRGKIYRHDNAPDFPAIATHPAHLHDGEESNVKPSRISNNPYKAAEQILDIIRIELENLKS
jgi:hypothetical protein